MARTGLSRRAFLARSAVIGCSAAASPLLTPVTLASAPWDHRLVVIILRGGMDGLDVVQPHGDPGFQALRPSAPPVGSDGGPLALDGFFALHPALAPLMPLWRAGELGFVHAVSTPYRDKRSHFDGQDILEAGTAGAGALARDGWLNRMLQVVPGIEAETAYAVGRSDMLLTKGAAPVANWSPDAGIFGLSPQAMRLVEMVAHDDPLFSAALLEAVALSEDGQVILSAGEGAMAEEDGQMMRTMTQNMEAARSAGGHRAIAEFAAGKLSRDTRIAAFSINGWDTHANQARTLKRPLVQLSDMLLALKAALPAPVWGKTTVIAMTEFGRTARLNGTGGTDHGTGGAMLVAGGAVAGGQVFGDWPGLGEAALYDRRDLMPTRDIRAHAAWIMRALFGLERGLLEEVVFPGVEIGADPKLIR